MSPLNRPHKIEVAQDANGDYRWRRRAGNSQIISVSGEGYKRKTNMWHGLRIANADHETVNIVDTTEMGYEEGESPSS